VATLTGDYYRGFPTSTMATLTFMFAANKGIIKFNLP